MQKVEVTSKYSDNYQVNEAFKALRTNILFCGSDIKVIVVTSCQPSEGKSSVSAETAIAMAQMGKKVLLIDLDLRKPSQHEIFDRKGESFTGIAEWLKNKTDP